MGSSGKRRVHGGGPQYLADYAACWVNNPTDMIDLANALYFRRAEWLNGQYPDSAAQGTVQEERRYPGWTEVPVENTSVKNQDNWTTMGIRLPANVCNDSDGSKTSGSITLINDCLDSTAKVNLECQITDYVELGYIKPGSDNITKRPGSYVTIIKDYQVQDSTRPGQFERKFYCENWVSPNQYWQIVYVAKDDPNGNGKGACYIEFGPAWQGCYQQLERSPLWSQQRRRTKKGRKARLCLRSRTRCSKSMLLVKRRHLDHRCRRDTTRGGLEGAYTYTQNVTDERTDRLLIHADSEHVETNVAERRMDYRRYCLRRTCWFPPQTGGTSFLCFMCESGVHC